MEKEEEVPCSNCNKMQGASRVHLHEAYCLRNIRKCPDCEEFIDKKELEKHKEETHTAKPCKYCKNPFPPASLDLHEKTECTRKPERCAYCTLDVPSVDYAEHVSACGARTKECFICQKSIVLFNFDNHIETCLGPASYEDQFPSTSTVSGNTKGGFPASNNNNNRRVPPPTIPASAFGGRFPIYNPANISQPSTRVQIGDASSIAKNSKNLSDEFARRMKMATDNNDAKEIQRLQEEEDERLAREMMSQYSPKQKEVSKLNPNLSKKVSNPNNFEDEYDYDYDYNDNDIDVEDGHHDYEDYDQQSPSVVSKPPTVVPQQQAPATGIVKEMQDMNEFCEDPELQEAILQSQQFGK